MPEASRQNVTLSCPKCGGGHVHRSRRRMFERWLAWLFPGQRMYRCYHCQYRFRDNKRGPSRYVSATPDLAVAGSIASDPAGSTHTSGAKRKRRHRSRSRDERTVYGRFRVWLYRKHSLTVGMLVLIMTLGGGVFVFLFWALDRWG